jgi:hypothetical protein
MRARSPRCCSPVNITRGTSNATLETCCSATVNVTLAPRPQAAGGGTPGVLFSVTGVSRAATA